MNDGPVAFDPVFVDVVLERDDVDVWASATTSDPQRQRRARWYQGLRTVALSTTMVGALIHPQEWVLWVAVVAGWAALAIEAHARRAPRSLSAFVAMNGRYSVSPRGLSRRSDASESLVAWAAIERISQTGNHVVVRFRGGLWVLPSRCFGSIQHQRGFVEAMQDHVGRASQPLEP